MVKLNEDFNLIFTSYTFNFQISSLISKQYISNVNETELLIKRNNLNRILSKYCATLPGCGVPRADQIPVKIDLVVATVRGDQVFCRQGVNFINILRTNFSYKCCFGSFFYIHVTRKKGAKMTFCTKNTRI